MLKKLLILFIAIAPVAVVAQNVQIAVVNSQEIFDAMPELSDVERQLADRMQQMEATVQELQTLGNTRITEYHALPPETSDAIRQEREREIMQISERLQTFVQQSQQELVILEFTLLEPVRTRIADAIAAVANEGGYTFVFERGVPLFVNDNAVDITPRVRARLGLR